MKHSWNIFAIVLISILTSTFAWGQDVWRQEKFAIGFWVDPPLDQRADERYKEIAEAGFNQVIGITLGTPRTKTDVIKDRNHRVIELCKKYGLDALVRVGYGKTGLKSLPTDKTCVGYSIRDEPQTSDFKTLAKRVAEIRQKHPDKLSFINLFPSYAGPKVLLAKNYSEYVSRFVETVNPQVLCMDHYPAFIKDGKDPRPLYRKDLLVIRENAQKANIPYWMFFNIMPYGGHTDPTEAQVRWQVYTSVTYGVKGLLYFCYYTPPKGREFAKGGAIIDRNGRKTHHYWQAQRINKELNNLGPVLMKLSSQRILHLEGKKAYKRFGKGPLRFLTTAEKHDSSMDIEVGFFKHEDGREAVMVMNNDITYAIWPTIKFSVPAGQVVEVDKRTGKEVPFYDESPAIRGLQFSLQPGDGRLFLISETAK